MNIGYIRTSLEENTENQLLDCTLDKIYNDITSLNDICPEMQKMLDELNENDMLHIQRAYCVADTKKKLQNFLNKLQKKKVTVTFYEENITIPFNLPDDHYKKQIALLRLKLDNQCRVITEKEEKSNSKSKVGRPPKHTEEQLKQVERLLLEKPDISTRDLSKETGVSKTTCYRIKARFLSGEENSMK